jgi:hypothetical protein
MGHIYFHRNVYWMVIFKLYNIRLSNTVIKKQRESGPTDVTSLWRCNVTITRCFNPVPNHKIERTSSQFYDELHTFSSFTYICSCICMKCTLKLVKFEDVQKCTQTLVTFYHWKKESWIVSISSQILRHSFAEYLILF